MTDRLTEEQLDALPFGSVVEFPKDEVPRGRTDRPHGLLTKPPEPDNYKEWWDHYGSMFLSREIIGSVLVTRPLPDDAAEVADRLINAQNRPARQSAIRRAAAILRGEP